MDEQYSSVVDFVEAIDGEIRSVAICGTSYTASGGIARVIEQQADSLAREGYDVDVYTLVASETPPEGVELYELGRFETTPYKELDKLTTSIGPKGWQFISAMESTDLVIAHRFPFSLLSYLAARVHDTVYTFWSHPSQSSDDLFDGAARLWAKFLHHLETSHFTIKRVDYICAVSESSRDYIESRACRKAICVPNSVSESRFPSVASGERIEREFDIDPGDTVVLHVGRITPRKNLHELVEAFEAATDGDERCKLVLVGKENMDEYSESVRERASDQVKFTGFVDDETLAGLYERSDVYATCSLSEGWGLPLSEANRFNTPIVAYDAIPATSTVENAVLAESGNRADFESKLGATIEGQLIDV